MRIPEAEPIYTTAYQNFKGVDFSSSIPDRQHFPLAKNFIITDSVNKRNGYECISKLDGRINGIFKFSIRYKNYTLIHAGDKLFRADENFHNLRLVYENIADSKSKGFCGLNEYFILTGFFNTKFKNIFISCKLNKFKKYYFAAG